MRTEFINQFAELNAMALENLTRETKETVAAMCILKTQNLYLQQLTFGIFTTKEK